MRVTSRISETQLAIIDTIFRAHHARGAAPTTAWGVFDRSGLVHFASAGELSPGTPPNEHTAYRVASCTKSFTAAAVLRLRDAGELQLDAPITDFVPAFTKVRLPSADSPVPTVRMLLTMSAGFPTDNPWGDRQESLTEAEFMALLSNGLRFDSIPGTRFAYSNLGYALLGYVIEHVTAQPYRRFIQERFIGPLGLTGTGFDQSVPAAGGIAVGARWLRGAWEDVPFSPPGAFSPIGGLFSTAADLAHWSTWLAEAFDPVAAEEADAPLSRASRRELQQLHRPTPPGDTHAGGYGFGVFVEHAAAHRTVVSHSGGYPGFSSHMRWLPETGEGIVAFENATFSRSAVPASAALDAAFPTLPRPVDVWPATRAAQAAITALIHEWSDDAARAVFAENVAWDMPLDERRSVIDEAIDAIGGLIAEESNESAASAAETSAVVASGLLAAGAAVESSVAPSHLVWFIPGEFGRLRAEIELTPENPPRVQSLAVKADRV